MATTKAKKKPESAKKATKAKGTTTKAKKPAVKKAAKKTPAKAKKTTSKAKVAHPVKHKTAHKKKAAQAKVKEAKFGMDEQQKADLLPLIHQIIEHRSHRQGGLRSFYMIDRILDFYNQKYTHPETKFDAIVEYGAKKHRGVGGEDVFVIVNAHEQDETELYKILSEVEKSKIEFDEIKSKLESLANEFATEQ